MQSPHPPSLIQNILRPIIKICGITNIEDARLCRDLGATHLGLIFAKSPRQVTPEIAQDIVNSGSFVSVGVFMDQSVDFVNEQIVDIYQIHSFMSVDELKLLKKPIWYVVNGTLPPAEIEEEFVRVGPYVQMFLLDTPKNSTDLIKRSTLEYLKSKGYFFIVAGGVKTINANELIIFGGVDVCSSLEARKGKKDYDKVAEFMESLKCISS